MRINDPKYLGSPADVGRGLRIGAIIGALFGIRAAISSSRGSSSFGNPWLIVAAVMIGGCVAGAIVGALRPLARRFPVAVVLGFVAVFPVLVALDVIRSRVTYPPGEIRWVIDGISALILGSLGVLAVRAASPSGRRG